MAIDATPELEGVVPRFVKHHAAHDRLFQGALAAVRAAAGEAVARGLSDDLITLIGTVDGTLAMFATLTNGGIEPDEAIARHGDYVERKLPEVSA